jgi:hypothetical protein
MGRKSEYVIPEENHKLNKDRCLCPGGETCKNGSRCHYERSDGTISFCRNKKKTTSKVNLCETCQYAKKRVITTSSNVHVDEDDIHIKEEGEDDASVAQMNLAVLSVQLGWDICVEDCEPLNKKFHPKMSQKVCHLASGDDQRLNIQNMSKEVRMTLCQIIMATPPRRKDIEILWKKAKMMLKTKYQDLYMEYESKLSEYYDDNEIKDNPKVPEKVQESIIIQKDKSTEKNVQSIVLEENSDEDEKSNQEQMLDDSSDEEEDSAEKSAENSISEENLISEEKSAEMEISEENLLSPDPLATRAPRARKETARERDKREKEEKKWREATRIKDGVKSVKDKEELQKDFDKEQKLKEKAYKESVRKQKKRKIATSSNEERDIEWDEGQDVGFLINDFSAKNNVAEKKDSLVGAIICGFYFRYQEFETIKKLAKTKKLDSMFKVKELTKPVMQTIIVELKRRMMEAAVAIIQTEEPEEHRFFQNNDPFLMTLSKEGMISRMKNINENNGNFGVGNTLLLLSRVLGLDIMLVQGGGDEEIYRKQYMQYPAVNARVPYMSETDIKMNVSSIMMILAHNVVKDNYNHLEPLWRLKRTVKSNK